MTMNATRKRLPPRPKPARGRCEGAVSILSRVGNTPLLRLGRIAGAFPDIDLFAKAEWFNPGGSIKDRAALAMIREGERTGALTRGRTILDATSGNTGISYAMIGAALGYRVRLVLPANASPERRRILAIYGADLVFTDPAEGSDGAIRRAREIHAADPGRWFYPDQYGNPANWRAHYDGTAPEIHRQTGGAITHFVAAVGSSGTFMGTTRRLKEIDPSIRCISVQPDGPFHGLEGMKHMESSIVPDIYDPALADEEMAVSTEEACRTVLRLVREEGLFVGVSSGAAVAACLRVAERISRGREPAGSGPPGALDDGRSRAAPPPARRRTVVVTILPDGGEKYLSERFWDEETAGAPRGLRAEDDR